MQNIKWMIGKSYYQAKGWLINRGFYMKEYAFDNDLRNSGWCKMSNGCEDIVLYTDMKFGKNGKIQCDKILRYKIYTYD